MDRFSHEETSEDKWQEHEYESDVEATGGEGLQYPPGKQVLNTDQMIM